jgi:hypothetical protein
MVIRAVLFTMALGVGADKPIWQQKSRPFGAAVE